jgi:hypothetical protein
VLWAHNHYWTKSFSFSDYVFWFPKACKEHISKFKQCWFGPYKIQYCLHNNTTLMVTFEYFDPNPILVNINKLKPYWFPNTITSRWLELVVERGRGHSHHFKKVLHCKRGKREHAQAQNFFQFWQPEPKLEKHELDPKFKKDGPKPNFTKYGPKLKSTKNEEPKTYGQNL